MVTAKRRINHVAVIFVDVRHDGGFSRCPLDAGRAPVLGVEPSYLSKAADPTDFVDRKAVEIEIVHVGVFAACRQKPGKALPTRLNVLV